jgi:heme/copper-type cytochrome/quinol oxidase subunit 2
MSPRGLAAALVAASAAIAIGMLGAWAFNPDTGAVAHIEALWRIFGIAVYLGVLAIVVIGLTALVLLAVRGADGLRRS